MQKYEINNLITAIKPIILKKFDTYYNSKINSDAIKALINAEITKIEAAEDMIADMTQDVTFNGGDSIVLKGYYFYYSEEDQWFKYGNGNIKESAKNIVLSKEGFNNTWRVRNLIEDHIRAVITTLEPDTSYAKVVEIVERDTDFDFFIELAKN